MNSQITLTLFLVFSLSVFSQKIVLSGKVTDSNTGEAIPFATIHTKGGNNVTQTDFDGYFNLSVNNPTHDSLYCGYVGYTTKSKVFKLNQTQQNIDFQLTPTERMLDEVVIKAGENPAFRIIRNAVANKNTNDKRRLNAYEYESYNRTEIDVDNISSKLKRKKVFRQIGEFMDSMRKVAGEDGKPILPIFISESISKVYYRDNLPRLKEQVMATRVKGVGVDDASLVSQIIGSSFQEYNFYKSYINILNKDIPSPISENWRVYYDYFLADSMFIDTNWCYKIEVDPRNKADLTFKGVIWIADQSWALKRVDLTIPKEANINFIDQVKIQQEMIETEAKAWLPTKQRILIDMAELSDSSAGLLVKFYTSNKDLTVQKPKEQKFYDNPLEVQEDVVENSESYWSVHRHDTLSQTEKNIFLMVDSLKKLPAVKTYIEIADVAVNGYKTLKKIDLGPYLYAYAYNNLEGSRLQLGARTNTSFSKRLMFKVYGAYGTLDTKWKYFVSGKYIFSRKKWSELIIEHKKDIEQLALNDDMKEGSNLFSAFARWVRYRRPYWTEMTSVYFHKDIYAGFSSSIKAKYNNFVPEFNFGYYEDPSKPDVSPISETFQNFELMFELRYARRELFLQNNNERISLGTKRWPIVTFRVYQGMKGFLNSNYGDSDFDYTKLMLNLTQNFRLSYFGTSYYSVTACKYRNNLPYPLLGVHLGNETYFFNLNSFNSMNFFEFVSDRYISANYVHYFEGFFLNRIPLMKKLKWREVVGLNMLYGSADPNNLNYLPEQYKTVDGDPAYRSLGDVPYFESCYGVENIFKFLRVTITHRLNYLDNGYNVNQFGLKLSAHFKL